MIDEFYSPQWKGQRLGGRGLEYLGMPTVWDHRFSSGDPYIYAVVWTYEGRDLRSYAGLYAELWVLQAFGLIEIGVIEHPDDDRFVLAASFRYTDEGALLAWEESRKDDD